MKPLAGPRHAPLGNGLHRTVTGSALQLHELNQLLEKAGEQECPQAPSSIGARTPRSNSGFSLTSGSRASSIVQVRLWHALLPSPDPQPPLQITVSMAC